MDKLEGSARSPAAARLFAVALADPRRRRSLAIGLEGLLAAAVVIALTVDLWRFHAVGYLPQPFLYDLNYPLMGLYDTAYWANNAGAYDIGKNIYPPLSFVFLRLTTVHRCYRETALLGRDCDLAVRWVILGFYIANVVLMWRCFRRLDPATAAPRTIAMTLGLPMLYGLECANLIIVAFTFFVLGYAGARRPGPLRWLALGLAINFKPYLLVLLAPAAVRRNWRWLSACALAAGGVYAVTFAVQHGGSPFELTRNLTLYAVNVNHKYWSDLYYGTSYWPLIRFMSAQFLRLGLSSSHAGDAWRAVFTLLIFGAQIGAVTCLIGGALRPAEVNPHRFAAMVVAIVLTTIATGQSGYVQIFLFFLIFLEPGRGLVRIVILACVYLLSIPADYVLAPVIDTPAWSWLGGRPVQAHFGISLGQLIRPAVLMVI
ncbi:MAG: hypothetical protein M3Y22_13885, partial [Pseudomonadota bacterium]|nr:hypothetical protein [Pseudomonadota bacterium]